MAKLNTRLDKDRSSHNSIYVEAMGPGGAYSINYDRIVYKFVTVRVGLSYFGRKDGEPPRESSFGLFTIPMLINGIAGARGHYFEGGMGAALAVSTKTTVVEGVVTKDRTSRMLGTAFVGYRFHPLGTGFNFRVGFSPYFGNVVSFDSIHDDGQGFMPWGYMSFGASF